MEAISFLFFLFFVPREWEKIFAIGEGTCRVSENFFAKVEKKKGRGYQFSSEY